MPVGVFMTPLPVGPLVGPVQTIVIAELSLMPFFHIPVVVSALFRLVPRMIVLMIAIIITMVLRPNALWRYG